MSNSTVAQLAALGFLIVVTGVLLVVHRKVVVATASFDYTTSDDVKHTVGVGQVVPASDVKLAPAGTYATKRLPLFRSLVVGVDNRTSTSTTVVFAWTYAVAYGLVALIVARWLGSGGGFDHLANDGLREEYWLLLGGTYASAILAKAAAGSPNSGKSSGAVGEASVTQLVTNDSGDADIGDFQYILFNVIALAFYLGQFCGHLADGMPHLPAVLTGLALTSAGGYSAKKLFLQQARPTLSSVLPAIVVVPAAGVPAVEVEVWGSNLIVPADAAPGGTSLPPTVTIAGLKATVTSSEQTLGADHLTVQVPAGAAPDAHAKLSAVRADGVAATATGGADGLGLVLKAPASSPPSP